MLALGGTPKSLQLGAQWVVGEEVREGDCMAVVHPHGLLGELGVQFWKSQTEMPFATSKASVQ